MKNEITIQERPEQPALTIRENADLESIPEKMSKIFSEILEFMGTQGIVPAGAPFAYWHNMNQDSSTRGIFDMECSFPISDTLEGTGRIKRSKLPGGKAVTAIHIGPYETLNETYNLVLSWIKENGFQVDDDMWETYLTDPCKMPDSSKWITEISFHVK